MLLLMYPAGDFTRKPIPLLGSLVHLLFRARSNKALRWADRWLHREEMVLLHARFAVEDAMARISAEFPAAFEPHESPEPPTSGPDTNQPDRT